MNRQQAPQPVVRPIQPGDKLSKWSGLFADMPYETWLLFRSSVRVGNEFGSLIVRRRSLDDSVEVAGNTGNRNVFLVVKGELDGLDYVVTSLSEEFTDELTKYDDHLSELCDEWGGLRYNIIDELQPHVEQWFEM